MSRKLPAEHALKPDNSGLFDQPSHKCKWSLVATGTHKASCCGKHEVFVNGKRILYSESRCPLCKRKAPWR